MKDGGYNIVRVGMGITFLWIGLLIFKSPATWSGLVQPWVASLLHEQLEFAMTSTAILDIVIGFLLIVDVFTWIAALVASVHLLIVIATVGIDEITVRDIALLTGCLALMWNALPDRIKTKFHG